MNKERVKQYLETGANITALGVIASVTLSAFSRKTRKEIFERDNYTCVDCGATKHLEGAHDNHDKDNPDYDSVHTGRCRCSRCHYLQHSYAKEFPEDIGMKYVDWNRSAIASLYERLPYEWKMSVPPPEASFYEICEYQEAFYGDPDYWMNVEYEDEPIVVEDWPTQQELPNFAEVYSNRRKRV